MSYYGSSTRSRLLMVGRVTPAPKGPQLTDATFRLSEGVCRLLTRATLDARVIGDTVHYRDNGVTSDVQTISRSVNALDPWLDVHEYLVSTVRKFRGDAEPLRRFAGDVVEVFERGGPNPFIGWIRAVSSAVRCVRCVFDDSEAHARLVHGLRLQNLDSGILGPNYEEESLVIEPGRNHCDLLGPELIASHLERVLAMLT